MLDLKKAYQAIHTSEKELHLHRFFFRASPHDDWEIFGYTRATFGDLAAGLILEVAKRRVADLGREIDPQAADQLKKNAYVDDAVLGGDKEDVQRMRGKRSAEGYTGTVPQILAKGGLKVKFMAITGSSDKEEARQLGGKTLGVSYRLQEDEVFFLLRPCYYSGKSSSSDVPRELVLLTRGDLVRMRGGTFQFTCRQALSMLMAVYDPLGLISPALVRGKILLRRLYEPQVTATWDQDLPGPEKNMWAEWFESLLGAEEAVFPRSTRPACAVGIPRLAGYCDSSLLAMCVCIYVVWTLASGESTSRILIGKCRVAPLVGMTIPRGELQALVILHRLLLVVVEAFPSRVASISAYTDSLCSLGALGKPGSHMRPYFANRVSEVWQLRDQLTQFTDFLVPVRHVPGTQNPSDVGTRGTAELKDLGQGSAWQHGPSYLVSPFEEWPLGEEVWRGSIPEEECKDTGPRVCAASTSPEVMPCLVATTYAALESANILGQHLRNVVEEVLSREKLELACRVFARVLKAVFTGNRDTCRIAPSRRMLELAVQVILRVASPSARQAIQDGKCQGLGPEVCGGIVWVSAQVRREELATLLGVENLPILVASEKLAYHCLAKAHREDHHRSPQDIVMRSRRSVWILGAVRVAKKVARACFKCRRQDKTTAQQLMGQLPPERVARLAPFEAAALDLFGSFPVKGSGKWPPDIQVLGCLPMFACQPRLCRCCPAQGTAQPPSWPPTGSLLGYMADLVCYTLTMHPAWSRQQGPQTGERLLVRWPPWGQSGA